MGRTRNIWGVLSLVIGMLITLAGCDGKPAGQAPPPGVRYTVIAGERLSLITEQPGRVSSFMVSEVRPQVTGILQTRFFEEGADVEGGQVLYQIDPALFEADCNSAEANLAKARANEVSARLLAERYGKIVKSNAVSRQEYDDAVAVHAQAVAEVEAARQALETARINLGYTRVTAPVSGRISRSFVTPGALVTRNQAQPLATIQHMNSVYVDITQSNTELLRLRRALAAGDLQATGPDSAKVKLKLEDGSPYVRRGAPDGADPVWVEGDLLFSDVTIEKSTGVVNIRAKFENPDDELLPGMYVRGIIEEGVLDKAVLVPQRAVMRDTAGASYVYVLSKEGVEADAADNIFSVQKRPVDINRNVGNRWLISSGLEPGDLLLVEGHLKAKPGAKVSGTAFSGALAAPHEILKSGRSSAADSR